MSTFSVTRNALIPAKPEDVYRQVIDFHKWTAWSPWENVDPKLQRKYSGNDSGVGAHYEWAGKKAGSGSMHIDDAVSPNKINIDLRFTKPMKAVNPTVFTFTPEAGGTRVTWTMTGETKGLGRVFALFMNMDKMVGKDFEKGLIGLTNAVAADKSES
ncbi:SRPBCC family protein [Arthrobacter sp. M4]|uniref:SRPBCC family protein n=1 Tax=Arthrobacter sp. M4 TaxID=218160 RepID=UPI001CDBE4E5|nr:SRPBCC family protein [Arthrobacter sp. M4]MCA4134375.1 SRPBCC family protein [Arthrobacter sp. M4]